MAGRAHVSGTCTRLHALCSSLPSYGFPFDRAALPHNGIYVLYEAGEGGHGGPRIVRIGTHTGQNQFPSRLEQHFLKENKDRSIFRKNIGRALLARDEDPFLSQWELDLTTSAARAAYGQLIDGDKQLKVERRVSAYLRRAFTFVVFRIDGKEERLRLESRMISTVSLCNECGPSASWLGLQSPKEAIRQSGLWLVNELYKEPLAPEDLALLARAGQE